MNQSTVSRSRASSPPVVRRSGRCRLYVEISGNLYSVRPVPRAGRGPGWSRAFRVLVLSHEHVSRVGKVYFIGSGRAGVACSCPDFLHNSVVCKHLCALSAAGLLPARLRPVFACVSVVPVDGPPADADGPDREYDPREFDPADLLAV